MLVGKKINRWTILRYKKGSKLPSKHAKVYVLCECGSRFWRNASSIKTGASKSCGCTRRKNGCTPSDRPRARYPAEYNAWSGIERSGYRAEEWKNNFKKFLEDMGRRPGARFRIDRYDLTLPHSSFNSYWRDIGKNKEIKMRRKHLSRLRGYGLTESDYDSLLKRQDGACWICKTKETEAKKGKLHIDHCHNTSVVRGLLCNNCNAGLGMFFDTPFLLRRAARYLERKL